MRSFSSQLAPDWSSGFSLVGTVEVQGSPAAYVMDRSSGVVLELVLNQKHANGLMLMEVVKGGSPEETKALVARESSTAWLEFRREMPPVAAAVPTPAAPPASAEPAMAVPSMPTEFRNSAPSPEPASAKSSGNRLQQNRQDRRDVRRPAFNNFPLPSGI